MMMALDVPEFIKSRFLNHTNIKVTATYTKAEWSLFRTGMQKIEQGRLGQHHGLHAYSRKHVPARSAFVMSVVQPQERAAAASFTAMPRSLASAVSPLLAGWLFQSGWSATHLVVHGVLKIAYDLALWRAFRLFKHY